MGSTVIFTHGGGRFANQLIQFGHLIAMAEEQRDLCLVNYSFWPYADLCAGTSGNPLCFYAPNGQRPPAFGNTLARCMEGVVSSLPSRIESSLRFRLPKMAHKYLPFRSVDVEDTWGGVEVTAFGGLRRVNPTRSNSRTEDTFNLGNPALLARLRRPGSVLLAGWLLQDWTAFDRHADQVRAFLAPADRFQKIAKAFVIELRRKHKTLVGVLIRQQDYRIWNGGRCFFPSPQYREWMSQAAKVFGPDCCLVVATDEVQPRKLLDGLNAAWCTGAAGQDGHFVESMAELSMCDVILSPPSTFTGWAAFLGNVPLLPLTHSDQVIRREDLVGDPFYIIESRPKAVPALQAIPRAAP
jgi:hypothetical protein